MSSRLSLDPLLLTELRLAIMSILVQMEEVDYNHIKEVTGATAGNISVQSEKLAEAHYIEIIKGFEGKRPKTLYRITESGRDAFFSHFDALKSYLPSDK